MKPTKVLAKRQEVLRAILRVREAVLLDEKKVPQREANPKHPSPPKELQNAQEQSERNPE